MFQRKRCLLTLVALGLLIAGATLAQTTFGVIRGRVLDPTGAAIPKVNVVVTNTGTYGNQHLEDGCYE